jgi:plastocyanin
MHEIRTALVVAAAAVLFIGACAAAPGAVESPVSTPAVPAATPATTTPDPTPEPTPTPEPSPTETATEPPATEPPATETSLSISTAAGTTFAFVPSEAEAPTGADVRLRFRNASTVPHNLTFGMPIEAATDAVVQPGGTETIRFTAPEPGDYTFVCTIHIGMSGTLRVTD